jgi:GTP-binding protein LepA
MPAPRGAATRRCGRWSIDSWFDNYVGVVMLVRVVDGTLSRGERIRLMASDASTAPSSSASSPRLGAARAPSAGEVGFVIAGHQGAAGAQGRRHDHAREEAAEQRRRRHRAAAGFKEIQPQVFAGLYPTEASEYDQLRDALEKLKLNDSSLRYEPEVSQALGFGFRCGFLGLLHMEIVQERLEREFDQDLITTAPVGRLPGRAQQRAGGRDREPVEDADLGRIAEIRSRSSPCTSTCRRNTSAR